MKRIGRIAAIILIAAFSTWVHAQSKSAYTTVVIEYIGKTDRPIPPIIIGSSTEEAESYRDRLFRDPFSDFVDIYIVQEATMKEITEIFLSEGGLNRPTPTDGPRTAPALRLVMGIGHASTEAEIDAKESVRILGELQEHVSQYASLAGGQSGFERLMKQYLNKPLRSR